ncbi:MAG: paraslipin [Cyanobacteria bacterium QS_7_48_42]|jgi:regulator of protease activity HflC (stomatin/prohibitin superfamily)|nr:MAG: paraslipin [Cyanobacteria bacterium QH_7_48_89]PSO60517.1 MAG: paraslipin [Cyanobacteria bacterium QH_2_48_84]PSO73129.1 MAG: paraslipin [Cyanobacteria bacterium QH_3_48_40]PSO74658.1 MAG: paraslipin [Cyanobacteria bacterium QS_1_48_34]PSO85441.1 MAG: paraslipin [Cyanobacteria bacterium QH_9_48_43]PSO86961.1 MAG: paraslipin [Cyanobacteria bacterium QS_5_48_63]PSO88437.1 MAG: paraslipin [Cyanobacteria bacterium QS_6_48_18]PSO97628.1 MAG: paraslipin [Cyanobacteria bacterium SW_6_48_11]
MNQLIFLLISLVFGGSALAGSVQIVRTRNEALVESLGQYKRRLDPGLNFVIPFIDKVVYKETTREKVIDIPPQRCVTRDNVSIEVDAVVYWRIVDMEKAYYRVEDLHKAMENLVLTQIRSEMGKLELDQTFTAREEVNEILLRELDVATDPWGVKVTRVELRDITPSQAVQDSMELQMAAERKKRAAILTSEGEKESAVNTARGQADSSVLEAEAQKKATVLKAEAEREQQIQRAQATAEALQIITEKLQSNSHVREALQFLLTQNYLEMGKTIGSSESSKVMFMDPRNLASTLEGMRSVVGEDNNRNSQPLNLEFDKSKHQDNS